MKFLNKIEPIFIAATIALWAYSFSQYFLVPESHTFSLGAAMTFSSFCLFQIGTDKKVLKWWFMGRRSAEECLKEYIDKHPTCLVINVGYILAFEKRNKDASTVLKSKASDEVVYPNYKLIKKVLTAIEQSNIKPLNFTGEYAFASVYIFGVHGLYMNLYFMSEEDRAAFEFFLNGMPD